MLVVKGYRYRIHPTPAQVARLSQWSGACRFLSNLSHEQHLAGHARHYVRAVPRCFNDKCKRYQAATAEHGPIVPAETTDACPECKQPVKYHRRAAGAVDERRWPTAWGQCYDLKALCAELPWLADVPRDVCNQVLVERDKAWQRCFLGLGNEPRWKRKYDRPMGVCEPHPAKWRVDGDLLRFSKIGNVRIIMHRPLAGKAKTCTIRRDGDQWFAAISCEVEVADPASRVEPVVGIDRGVVNAVADSDGNLVENPRFGEAMAKTMRRAQRTMARRKKGSKNWLKAKTRVDRLHRKVRRQRDHFVHGLTSHYAKSHGTVVVEKLQIKNMTASAAGTTEEPGRNVAAKSGLNRAILDSGWGRLTEQLRYKLEWAGGRLVEVPAAYSSQTCAAYICACGWRGHPARWVPADGCPACGCVDLAPCGHVAAENRPDQATFHCVKCGHTDHADTNAAKVIKTRANRSGLPGEGSPSGTRRARKRLRVARRRVEHVTAKA